MVRAISRETDLPDSMQFGTLVTGRFNDFATTVLRGLLAGQIVSPRIMLVGPIGVGKTHLCTALAREWLKSGRSASYWTAGGFTLDCRNDAGSPEAVSLRDCLVGFELVIVDDIQLIPDETALARLAELFNARAGRPTVVVSQLMPWDLPRLSQASRGKLSSALILEIKTPSFGDLAAILTLKNRLMELGLNDESLTAIARVFQGDIQGCEGVLALIAAKVRFEGRKATLELVKEVLARHTPSEIGLTINMIIEVVAEHFSVAVEDLRGQGRTRELVTARHIAQYLIRELTDRSYPSIGREFDDRDHTTVMYGVNKVAEQVATRQGYYMQVATLMRSLQRQPSLRAVKND